MWRNKPLLRREGDKIFKTGSEAVSMLIDEAYRRDSGSEEFITSWKTFITSLSAVFERMPKYAWIMKQVSALRLLFLPPHRVYRFLCFRLCFSALCSF
jgi:hypothetical protein